MITVQPGIERTLELASAGLARLAEIASIRAWLDRNLPIPAPYQAAGDIRLVFIGQDPTVQYEARRRTVKTVLTLDEDGPLRRYLANLCTDLGLTLEQHVYATNACKCFFTMPPTKIKQETGFDVLAASVPVWLPILGDELARFPDAVVVSLGEPVLAMLVREGCERELKYYWGYDERWREGVSTPMCAIQPEESRLGRRIFPFVHQPTLRASRAAFYRERQARYINFIRQESGLGS